MNDVLRCAARAACWRIEKGCDGECAAAGYCKGEPALSMVKIARAVIEAIREPGADEHLAVALDYLGRGKKDPIEIWRKTIDRLLAD